MGPQFVPPGYTDGLASTRLPRVAFPFGAPTETPWLDRIARVLVRCRRSVVEQGMMRDDSRVSPGLWALLRWPPFPAGLT